MATIREWKNSFAHINRIPSDVLSLFPTHLSSQEGRFQASFVCRHWRRVLLQYGPLWSQLSLKKGEDHVMTFLDRAKGSALDVIAHRDASVGTITLLSPAARQIRILKLESNCLSDILRFSALNSGQLPILRVLEITSSLEPYNLPGRPHVVDPPLPPFFKGSPNLERFVFCSEKFNYLSLFVFPNLTTFELSTCPVGVTSALYLLDFLKASPMLRTVKLETNRSIGLGNVPRGMIVVLPNVETFSLHVGGNGISAYTDDLDNSTHVYGVATHISCPRAKHTFLNQEVTDEDMSPDLEIEIFPYPVSWRRIVHQYATSPIEEVTLEIKCPNFEHAICSLIFRSSDATVITLGFKAFETHAHPDRSGMSLEEVGWAAFSQACRTIRDHPQLSHVKRLHIKYRAALWDLDQVPEVADEVGKLFRFLGPLDELTIHGCDLHVFVVAFLDHQDFTWLQLADPILPPQIVFPQVKELAISHPLMKVHEKKCMDALVNLARSQYDLGKPFERMTVCARVLPKVKELRRWVGAVDCYEQSYE